MEEEKKLEEVVPTPMFKMPKQYTRKDLARIRHNSKDAAKARKSRKKKSR